MFIISGGECHVTELDFCHFSFLPDFVTPAGFWFLISPGMFSIDYVDDGHCSIIFVDSSLRQPCKLIIV